MSFRLSSSQHHRQFSWEAKVPDAQQHTPDEPEETAPISHHGFASNGCPSLEDEFTRSLSARDVPTTSFLSYLAPLSVKPKKEFVVTRRSGPDDEPGSGGDKVWSTASTTIFSMLTTM